MMLSAAELEDIKSDYALSLQDLTFNSKPIINMLTTIAQENVGAARPIARALEEHIAKAPPAHKLPAMYLLDSITKNIGPPYTPLFAQNLYKTFMDVYTAVDPGIRRKLEDLFRTWKIPVANSMSNQPVFPPDATRKIEEVLLKVHALQQQQQQQQQQQMPQYGQPPSFYPPQQQQQYTQPAYRQSPSPFPQQQAAPIALSPVEELTRDIDELMRIFAARLRLDPADGRSRDDLGNLQTLRQLLQSQALPAQQLGMIRDQIQTFTSTAAQQLAQTARNTPPPALLAAAPQAAHELFGALGRAQLLPQDFSHNTPPPPHMFPPGAVPPPPPQHYMAGMQQQQGQQHQPMLPPSVVARKPIVELTASSINQQRPELIQYLYNAMPLQCSLCGERWADVDQGRKDRDDHLDWHFRVNKRLREHAVRGQSRAAYLDEQDWINFSIDGDSANANGDAAAGQGESGAGGQGLAGNVGGMTAKQRTDALQKAQLSTVPKSAALAGSGASGGGGGADDLVCPICQEDFATDWDEGAEDWVLKNAILIAGTCYHATCQLEAQYAAAAATAAAEKDKDKQSAAPDVKDEDGVDGLYEGEEDEDIALPGQKDEEEEDDIALPGQAAGDEDAPEIKNEPSDTNGDSSSGAKADAAPAAFSFDPDALRTLAGSLSALTRGSSPSSTGTKRKAEDDGDSAERMIKREPGT